MPSPCLTLGPRFPCPLTPPGSLCLRLTHIAILVIPALLETLATSIDESPTVMA